MASSDGHGYDIIARGLGKTFYRASGFLRRTRLTTVALQDLDLEVPRGILFGLLGPNGAGKTTTVKILTTLLLPSSGSATVAGLDVVRQANAIRRRIGFVFGGDRGLYGRLSAMDNLLYFAALNRIPARTARKRIDDLVDVFGLRGREHERVERYSRGMKQRLHLARGLLADPAVLFLDEPTIGLDPVGARELRALTKELTRSGKTVFLTTHYMFEADAICDRIAVIKGGRLLAQGTPASLKRAVDGLGVVEFEVAGLPDACLQTLRSLPAVQSVVVADRELKQVVTIQTADAGPLAAHLPSVLSGVAASNVQVRPPTLEDVYVHLVSR